MSASTARSARCSSSPRPGLSWASTPTTTDTATPRTSTTPPWRPPSTSAPVRTTCPTRRGSGRRCCRYNHSETYVDLVLSIMNAYLTGDYTAVPNGTLAGGFLTPMVPTGGDGRGSGPGGGPGGGDGGGRPGDPGEQDGGPDGPGSPTPGTPAPTPTGTPAPTPTGGPTGGPKPTPTEPGGPHLPGEPAAEPDTAAAAAAHTDPAAPDTVGHHRGRGDRAVPRQGPDRQPARPQRRVRPLRGRPAQPLGGRRRFRDGPSGPPQPPARAHLPVVEEGRSPVSKPPGAVSRRP